LDLVKKTYFEDDIRKINSYVFGFFYCEFDAFMKDLMKNTLIHFISLNRSQFEALKKEQAVVT